MRCACLCCVSTPHLVVSLFALNFFVFSHTCPQSPVYYIIPFPFFCRAGVVAFFFAFLYFLLLFFFPPSPKVYHSTSPHKEFRFLLPVLPIAHAYAGKAVSAFILSAGGDKNTIARTKTKNKTVTDEPAESSQDDVAATTGGSNRRKAKQPPKASTEGAGAKGTGDAGAGKGESENEEDEDVVAKVRLPHGGTSCCRDRRGRRRRWRTFVAVGLFCLHMPAAVYLSVWHQSGALSAVDAVARRVPVLVSEKEAFACLVRGVGAGAVVVAVHFLMPCHSAPLHSHLHFRGVETALWSLDCSPK